MFNLSDFLTAEEIEMVRASAETEMRNDEMRADVSNAPDSFSAYWADSASASVLRDYKAGRVVNV